MFASVVVLWHLGGANEEADPGRARRALRLIAAAFVGGGGRRLRGARIAWLVPDQMVAVGRSIGADDHCEAKLVDVEAMLRAAQVDGATNWPAAFRIEAVGSLFCRAYASST